MESGHNIVLKNLMVKSVFALSAVSSQTLFLHQKKDPIKEDPQKRKILRNKIIKLLFKSGALSKLYKKKEDKKLKHQW